MSPLKPEGNISGFSFKDFKTLKFLKGNVPEFF